MTKKIQTGNKKNDDNKKKKGSNRYEKEWRWQWINVKQITKRMTIMGKKGQMGNKKIMMTKKTNQNQPVTKRTTMMMKKGQTGGTMCSYPANPGSGVFMKSLLLLLLRAWLILRATCWAPSRGNDGALSEFTERRLWTREAWMSLLDWRCTVRRIDVGI